MASEITQAAVLILRAKALETYGVMKGIYQRPAQQGDAEALATHALNLAQYEGAMLTVQQYFNNAEQPPPEEPDELVFEPEAEVSEEERPPPRVIGPEDSESMRRTMEAHAATRAAKEVDGES